MAAREFDQDTPENLDVDTRSYHRLGILNWLASNPWIGLVGIAASIIGIPLTIALHYASIKQPDLAFYPHPVKTPVVKAGTSSQIRVLYREHVIASDVTSVQVVLWNSGRASIGAHSILSPIRIVTHPSVPILEAKLRTVSRPVAGLAIDESGFEKGYVNVHWRILEQNDGGSIQITYAGSDKVTVDIEGIVEGQPKISSYRYPREVVPATATLRPLQLPSWLVGVIAGIVYVALLYKGMDVTKIAYHKLLRIIDTDSGHDVPRTERLKLWARWAAIGYTATVFGAAGVLLYLVVAFFVAPPAPPFPI